MLAWIACVPLMAGPPINTLEQAFDNFIDGKEQIVMAPRLPLFSSNDITYTAGEPDYDGGADLALGSNPSANFYGGAAAKRVGEFIVAQEGVRIAATSDSQFSGGTDRITMGIAKTWPVTWSRWIAMVAAQDSIAHTRNSVGLSDYYLDGSYANTATLSNGGTALSTILTNEGLGDVGELNTPFGWMDDPGTQIWWSALAVNSGTSIGDDFYDADNWGSNSSPQKVRVRALMLAGGSTNAINDVRFRFEAYNSSSTFITTNYQKDIASITGLTNSHTLNASNNNAVLAYDDSTVLELGTSTVGFRPRLRLTEISDIDNASFFLLGGFFQRMESDGTTEEDNISLTSVRYGSGQNPVQWIHGGVYASGTAINMGSNFGTRAFVQGAWEAPNVLLYSFGHNNPTRDISTFKAESAFQADYFDLIYQDCETIKNGSGLGGEHPKVIIHIPWYAANLDQTRHDEIIGVADALIEHGIDVLVVDTFNRYGGESFSTSASGDADWTTATTFHLDNDNDPAGTGVHPGDQNSARIVAYDIWESIVEAANSVVSSQQVRDIRSFTSRGG